MNLLLTGAFGNIGRSTLIALMARPEPVHLRCFDTPTPANRAAAHAFRRRYPNRLEVQWGDLRRLTDLEAAVEGIDAAIHLGFVIPRLSATGVNSEDRPDWAREVNVGGTANLITALQHEAERARPFTPRLIFASSLHVYGKTQHLPPPRTPQEIPHPVEHYAIHKIEAEGLVRASGLPWAILRLAAALPIRLILDPGMFDVPLANRIEFIHTRDAGQAFAAAPFCRGIWGKTLLIGGGPRCQLYYHQMMEQVLRAAGIGPLPPSAFAQEPYATDWLDTRESQALLGYQQRTFADYVADLRKRLIALRPFIFLFRPYIRRWLLAQSPYA